MRIDRTPSVLAAAVLLLATACSSFEVEGKGNLETQSTGQATVHGSFWGYEWSGWTWRTPAAIDQCEQQALAKVEVKTNVLYTLASLLSLGLYVPSSVEWWCSAPPRDDSSVEEGTIDDLYGGGDDGDGEGDGEGEEDHGDHDGGTR